MSDESAFDPPLEEWFLSAIRLIIRNRQSNIPAEVGHIFFARCMEAILDMLKGNLHSYLEAIPSPALGARYLIIRFRIKDIFYSDAARTADDCLCRFLHECDSDSSHTQSEP